MNHQTLQRIVFTGGPCSGKSTLISTLAKLGQSISTESGRAIIQAQMRINGPGVPWNNPRLYAELMLSREMEAYAYPPLESGYIFYDRGIPDIMGYLITNHEKVPFHLFQAVQQYHYHPQVFIFPPWKEIYTQDNERKQAFHEAVKTHEVMARVYGEAGYKLINVPKLSVEERAHFVLAELAKTD